MTARISALDAACWYAGLRLHSFPVESRGKAPIGGLVPNGKDDATADLSTLNKWFREENGHTPNIGIACGPSGIVVIDIDLPKPKNKHTDGRIELAALIADLGDLPITVTADTGSGGAHYLFRAPVGVELVGKLGKAIDLIRNGYIVAPPSIHESGASYSWRAGHAPDQVVIAELPPSWIEYARRPEPTAPRAPRPTTANGESVFDVLATLDQRYVLECVSGTSLVNGERFAFKLTRGGKWNLFVDSGDGFVGTSNFIDAHGKIGARGSKDGGPLASTWLRWYGHDDKAIRHGLIEHVPGLERFRSLTTKRSAPYPVQHETGRPVLSADDLSHDDDGGFDSPSPIALDSTVRNVRLPNDDDAGPNPGRRGDANDQRVRIVISTDRPSVVDAAERALAAMGGIYVRGRQLVHVVRDRGAPGWLKRPAGAPVIVPIERDHLLDMLGRAASWVVVKDEVPKQASVPTWVAAMLMARGEWELPQLEAIADSPVFRDDGTILDEPGYDERTRVIYDPCGTVFPPVPGSPTREDAGRALIDLLEPFSEFPFVGETDRAATAALILSMIGRSAIDGCVPMFSSQAPTPGSGKGLLVDVAATIATGRKAPLMAQTEDDEECRKRLLAIAIESSPVIVIDNVEGAIGSPALAMALTAGEIRDRLLGSTKIVTASLRPVWVMTGNNVQLKGDLGRRVVPIDLDPKTEHPEDRVFERGELLVSVAERRPELVVAALTLLRGYVVAGRPSHGAPAKGSFELWDRLVRGAIIWAGGADPLGGVQRIRDQADADLDQLRALLVAWNDQLGGLGVTIADAIKQAGDSGALREAIASYCRGGKPDARQMGYVLRKARGRVVAKLAIERLDEDRDGATKWAVVSKGCG